MLSHQENTVLPSPEEQALALASYTDLVEIISGLQTTTPSLVVENVHKKIKIPLSVLAHLSDVLKVMGQGAPVSVLPMQAALSTQAAADVLGCSRPHLVKLLESGAIPFSMVGRHRRVQLYHLIHYKQQKTKQAKLLSELMAADEAAGLYEP